MIDALFDWLGREGWIIINWWLLATVAGATVLPLVWRLLGGLPDRGYTLARPLGILLTAYTFWLLAVLGFLQNTAGNMVLAWLIVLTVSVVIYLRADATAQPFNLRGWWQENRGMILTTEVVFVVLLVSLAIFRAHIPDLTTTEKPMDLAFMSAAQRTLEFPPNDPWFAGFSISYYYFGYVIAAMFSTLAGVSTTIGYSMHLALLFALAGTAVFGLVYNLVRSRSIWRADVVEERAGVGREASRTPAIITGLLGTVFLVIMGSYQVAFVEFPYFSGASDEYLEFWDVNQRRDGLEITPDGPANWGYWWWFRSARPVSDTTIDGNHSEVIAEFPMFSFVLGDSHPHVMALPFVLLALGLALNVLLSRRRPDGLHVLFYGLCIGALVFLNTWDAPVYIMALVGADALRRLRRSGRFSLDDWSEMIVLGVSLLVILFVAYFPFLIGFRSQLGGVLPNLINPTGFQQIFLLFGPFLLILAVYLPVEIWRSRRAGRMNWSLATQSGLGLFLGMVFLLAAFTLLGMISEGVRNTTLAYINQNGGLDGILPEVLGRRLDPRALLTPIITITILLLVIGRLFPRVNINETRPPGQASGYPPASGFALMLVGVAFTLILIPEFVYLRDNFGSRMNTVFKFYYQSWVALSVACAYGVYTVLADRDLLRPNGALRGVFSVALVGIVGLGLLFPVLAVRERAWMESGLHRAEVPALSMDGGPRYTTFDDYQAARCLADLVGDEQVVVAEADPRANSGRTNYNPAHGRVGSLTGMPVILGWPGHQRQWRGVEIEPQIQLRSADLTMLYTDLRFDVVQPVIDRYGIDYIFYGSTERLNHGAAGEEKFRTNLALVAECEFGQTRIYTVPEGGVATVAVP